MEFKIEKGVPIPPKQRNKGYTDALRALKKGESVLLPVKISNVYGIVHPAGLTGLVTSRAVEGGTRVWRIK